MLGGGLWRMFLGIFVHDCLFLFFYFLMVVDVLVYAVFVDCYVYYL